MMTGFVLVRNLRSPSEVLHFANFKLVKIGSSHDYDLNRAQHLFPKERPLYEDWVYERAYDDSDGWDRIPFELEDALLLLRLFKTGDLFFVQPCIEHDDGSLSCQLQYPAMVDTHSTHRYEIKPEECSEFDKFASELLSQSNWSSSWFKIARRFFLYGGGKEYNPGHDQVDRIVDYMTALESILVPEKDFVGRRLRERAVSLLKSLEINLDDTRRLLSEFYSVRSAVVHGSSIISFKDTVLKKNMDFEATVRKIIVEAVKRVPHDDNSRKGFLEQLFDVCDQTRSEMVFSDFFSIKGQRERRTCFDRISNRLL